MSGYLTRLVAPAVGQRPRVHPSVDSIYARGARREEAAGFLFRTETSPAGDSLAGSDSETGPSKQLSAPNRDWGPPVRSSAPATRREAQSGARSGLGAKSQAEKVQPSIETTSATVGALEPLSLRAAIHERDAGSSRPVSARETTDASEPRTASLAAASGAPRREATSPSVWIYGPMIAEVVSSAPASSADSQAAGAAKRDAPSVPAPVSSRPVISGAAVARRARAPQPEDIQIHIGRIEVIALPPAAPRVAPPAVRKGLTLDEYLRESSVRAR